MASREDVDPTVDQIAAFIELVSRLTLSSRVQQRFAGTTNLVGRSELLALQALGRNGRLTYGDLAERLGLDPTTVSRLATGLLRLGLVTRVPDERDKRKAWLELTPAGAQLLRRVESVYIEYYDGGHRRVDGGGARRPPDRCSLTCATASSTSSSTTAGGPRESRLPRDERSA